MNLAWLGRGDDRPAQRAPKALEQTTGQRRQKLHHLVVGQELWEQTSHTSTRQTNLCEQSHRHLIFTELPWVALLPRQQNRYKTQLKHQHGKT
jgi:hypothetical protein